jgi:hypothetical protein
LYVCAGAGGSASAVQQRQAARARARAGGRVYAQARARARAPVGGVYVARWLKGANMEGAAAIFQAKGVHGQEVLAFDSVGKYERKSAPLFWESPPLDHSCLTVGTT